MNATFTGIHDRDHLLPDWSPAMRFAEVTAMRALHHALEAEYPMPVDGAHVLRDDHASLDAELARANLEVRIAEYESGFMHERNPALWTGEAIWGPLSLMIRPFAARNDRLVALARRLDAVPAFLMTMRQTISGPIPARWAAKGQKECATAERLFDVGLHGWLAEEPLDAKLVAPVLAAAAKARAAFTECSAWLATRPASGDDGYSARPELFGTLLARGHFSAVAPRALLAEAEAAMVDERAKLEEMTKASHGTWPAAQEAFAADHPTVDGYYAAFQKRWDECHAVAAKHDAVTWESWPIRYVPIPAWAREFAPQLYWLFYRSPAPFDPYTTYEYVVTPIDASMPPDEQEKRLRAWNNSTITLNHVVHHGAVGHHVQNWHARYRSTSKVGAISGADCASRIGMFLGGSMTEGWACYATQLMGELGMLTPDELLSEQHTRVRMLARAISDLRLHLGDWTIDQTIAFYQEKVGMSPDVAAGEATKNSMFPATAIMYWLGTKTILDLRATKRRQQGKSFSMRAFHDELLSRGAVPVALVATLMTEPGA